MAAKDLYQDVTDTIIAALEKGTAPWMKPWAGHVAGGIVPFNFASKKPYRGINILLLWLAADEKGYQANGWLTFNQAKALGGRVKKGEHGTPIYFFKPWEVTQHNDATGEDETKRIPLLKSFTVFNVAQIDGLPLPEVTEPPEVIFNPYDEAEAVIRNTGAVIHFGGDQAFYRPATDSIQLPLREAFKDEAAFYATAFHELTHWTGAKHRLDRHLGGVFGSESYAKEELVAEMGSAFLCAQQGIEGHLQHPSYIQSWLKVLKDDKKFVVRAASLAQKAADFILKGQAQEETEAEAEAA